ncbi:MAG: replicative DNA helicase [Calditrichaeota bacterium]|nr:replicative DNA helicase [Calditrichota bacterium]MCB9391551.1 replicative DNA helicase [Calditrichota bacterium]
MTYPAASDRARQADTSGVKVPPQAPEMERALLGSLLSDGSAFVRVAHLVEPESFYRPHHRTIFKCMADLDARREPLDLITVTDELRRAGKLEEVGGVPVLSELASEMPTSANIEHYASVVHEKALLRSVISLSTEAATTASEPTARADEVFEKVQRELVDLIGRRRGRSAITSFDAVKSTIEHIEHMKTRDTHVHGVSSGFSRLDDFTTGFNPGELIIIAARPSMGKTALAMNIATGAAQSDGSRVAIFSLEMDVRQLVLRMLSGEAHISLQRLRTGRMSREEYSRMSQHAGRLADLHLFFDDQPGLEIGTLRARARQLWLEHKIDMIVIDYLQLITPPKMVDNQQQWVAYVSASLKNLAKELKIPIIVLSQLSRATESRGGERKPLLSDLRDSGAIEQDADIVMFVYRPEYYKDLYKGKKDPTYEIGTHSYPIEGLAEIIIAKNRNGPTGSVPLTFLKEYTMFAPLESDEPSAAAFATGDAVDYGDTALPPIDDNPF